MADNPNLKPCPFCGRKPKITKKNSIERGAIGEITAFRVTFEIKCTKCHTSFYGDTYVSVKEHDVIQEGDGYQICIDQWNTRAGDNND